MKFLAKITLGSEEANTAIRDGSMMEKTQRILGESKPEAVYFATENGRRTEYLVLNIDDPQQMQAAVEPWWLLFNADISRDSVRFNGRYQPLVSQVFSEHRTSMGICWNTRWRRHP